MAVVQFIKDAWVTGERSLLERLGIRLLHWHTMGKRSAMHTQDEAGAFWLNLQQR